MKKTIYLACFLAIISAIAGGALALVNNMTAPIIKDMSIAAEKENLELIFPGAAFTEVEYTDETGLVKGMYLAEEEGYVFKVETFGYSSTPIQFMIAFDLEGKVVGYTVLSHQETSGFGSRVFDEEYNTQVIGKTSGDSFPLLTGATVTSTAVVKGIDAAKMIFNDLKGITVDPNATPAPVEKPALSLGNAKALDKDFAKYDAQVEDQGNGVYLVSVKGYGLLEGDSDYGDYDRNEFEIVIQEGLVESVKLVSFGDTKGIGDKIENPEYEELFIGLSVENMTVEVDTITQATWTSESMIAAVQAAMNAAKE